MLLPVYVSGYKFKEKIFNFFVNGNSGKTYGQVPRSPVKIFFAVLAAAALIIAAMLLFKNIAP
jgi:hypothetical protein